MADEYSEHGHANLIVTHKAGNFADWMYSEIKPFLSGSILEIGSGVGTYSQRVVRDFEADRVILSDIDAGYVRSLDERFGELPNVSCIRLDLSSPTDFRKIGAPVDCAFALNVLEHVEDDEAALENIRGILGKGGRLVLLVPAHKFLFNCIDEAVGHYRRYTMDELAGKAAKAHFRLSHMHYFNFPAIIGWYVNGNILRKTLINENAMGLYDAIVPVVRPFERYVLMRKMGISIIAVLERE